MRSRNNRRRKKAENEKGEAKTGEEEKKQENSEANMLISKAIRSREFGNFPGKFKGEKIKKEIISIFAMYTKHCIVCSMDTQNDRRTSQLIDLTTKRTFDWKKNYN